MKNEDVLLSQRPVLDFSSKEFIKNESSKWQHLFFPIVLYPTFYLDFLPVVQYPFEERLSSCSGQLRRGTWIYISASTLTWTPLGGYLPTTDQLSTANKLSSFSENWSRPHNFLNAAPSSRGRQVLRWFNEKKTKKQEVVIRRRQQGRRTRLNFCISVKIVVQTN